MNKGLIDKSSDPTEENPQPSLRWMFRPSVAAPLAILAVAVVMYGLLALLASNIRHVEVARETLGNSRPARASTGALNILVVGSDQRAGSKGSDDPGERMDTIMLVHLSPARNEAVVLSFPRDSIVQIPACRDRLASQPRRVGMINASFNVGGIGCTWKTIETLTGIYIDHVVRIDFNGFKKMVDAIGGVDFCIPEPIHDRYLPLDLPAGWQTLNGEQALGYVRVRHSIGDGSDIGRIGRQQDFVAAVLKKVTSVATLANPIRLVGLLNTATQSVITDPGVTPGVMRKLAFAVLSTDKVHFVIAPWRYSRAYPGRVEWRKGPSRKLFQLIATDKPLMDSDEMPEAPPSLDDSEPDAKPGEQARPAVISEPDDQGSIMPPSSAGCTLASAF